MTKVKDPPKPDMELEEIEPKVEPTKVETKSDDGIFPKELPASEPKPKKKEQVPDAVAELKAEVQKIGEQITDMRKVLSPETPPTPVEKKEPKLFDEWDLTKVMDL